jgi:hypothetical protein
MFLCENCHNVNNHIAMFESRGPCEGCGKTANCIDCYFTKCDKPKEAPQHPAHSRFGDLR